jgi:hypothetical protein
MSQQIENIQLNKLDNKNYTENIDKVDRTLTKLDDIAVN